MVTQPEDIAHEEDDTTVVVEDSRDLGKLVRERRRELGLHQADLAALCGVGRRFLSELERGKGTVRLDMALAVARECGLDLAATR